MIYIHTTVVSLLPEETCPHQQQIKDPNELLKRQGDIEKRHQLQHYLCPVAATTVFPPCQSNPTTLPTNWKPILDSLCLIPHTNISALGIYFFYNIALALSLAFTLHLLPAGNAFPLPFPQLIPIYTRGSDVSLPHQTR